MSTSSKRPSDDPSRAAGASLAQLSERSQLDFELDFFTGVLNKTESHTQRMKTRIDSEEGRARYGQRFATVEPVFDNIRHNKRLARFTLRGRVKVDTQWKLFCLVHNIEKLANNGYAQ